MCKATPFLQGTAVSASVNTLMAIAFDRYPMHNIRHPSRCEIFAIAKCTDEKWAGEPSRLEEEARKRTDSVYCCIIYHCRCLRRYSPAKRCVRFYFEFVRANKLTMMMLAMLMLLLVAMMTVSFHSYVGTFMKCFNANFF